MDVLEEGGRVVNAGGVSLIVLLELKRAIKTKESPHRAMNLMQITKVASHGPNSGVLH